MSVAGKWRVSMKTPIGTQKFTWDFTATGSGWHGVMEGQGTSAELAGLKVDGDSVGFDARVAGPLGMVDLSFSGSAAGDQISGTCRTRFGSFPFSGERA